MRFIRAVWRVVFDCKGEFETMAIRRVLVSRTECAEVEVEADSDAEARQRVVEMINSADCIADLEFDWNLDGGIHVESLADETVEQYFSRTVQENAAR